jgi:DNA repair exonuclease SbcCD ATPase subunit
MRLISIETSSYKGLAGKQSFEFADGITGIVGSNGAGKSTLMSAVAYCLYGPEVLPTGTADSVTWGENKMSANLLLEIDGGHYSIVRSQDSKGTSKAMLYKAPDKEPVASGPNAVNAEVEKLLGIDRVAFLISVFSRQEELLGIGSLQPAKRTTTILRLLGLDRIDDAIKSLSEQRREKQRELEAIRFSTQKEPESVESLNALLLDVTLSIDDLVGGLKDVSRECIVKEELLSSLMKNEKEWKAYLNQYTNASAKVDNFTVQLAVARRESIIPNHPVAPTKMVDTKKYEAERDDYDRRVIQLKKAKYSSVCPMCLRPFDENDNLYHLEREEKDLHEIEFMLKQKFEDYVASEAFERQLLHYKDVLLPRYRESVQRIETIQNQAKEAKRYLDSLNPVLDPTEALAASREALRELQVEVASLEGRVKTLQGNKEHLEYRLKIAVEAARDAERAKVLESESLALSITVAEMKDFKARQVSRVIPTISDTASSFTSDLTDGKYTELMLTAEYDIQYRNEQGDLKSFANLSGGERKSFALALRLAIADLRASKIGVLILDEVFESLDSDRQESAWTVLEKLSSRYIQIFMVSHVDRLKDRSPSTIAL